MEAAGAVPRQPAAIAPAPPGLSPLPTANDVLPPKRQAVVDRYVSVYACDCTSCFLSADAYFCDTVTLLTLLYSLNNCVQLYRDVNVVLIEMLLNSEYSSNVQHNVFLLFYNVKIKLLST